jgi:pimeloyl-ACP methyl ester carboxylesterase
LFFKVYQGSNLQDFVAMGKHLVRSAAATLLFAFVMEGHILATKLTERLVAKSSHTAPPGPNLFSRTRVRPGVPGVTKHVDPHHRRSPLRLRGYTSAVAEAAALPRSSSSAVGKGAANEWFNPVIKFGPVAGVKKEGAPVLLYVPGIHGSGLTPVVQFPELSTVFDIKTLSFDGQDRSTFAEIKANVKAKIREAKEAGREVYLVGESFGGIVALSLAIDGSEPTEMPDRVVLVNAASCFDRTLLGRWAPQLLRLPEPFFSITMMPAVVQLFDAGMFVSLAKSFNEGVKILDAEDRKAFALRVAPKVLSHFIQLRSGALKWRIKEWVLTGCTEVNSRFEKVKVPVLAVAGTADKLLPSHEEALKFKAEIPNCAVRLVEGSGHAAVLDQRIDLLEMIQSWAGSSIGRDAAKSDQA